MTDEALALSVKDELFWDPKVGGAGRTISGVSDAIQKAFKRDAKIDADNLIVAASDGTVTLSGSVRSWSEHDAAFAAAWAGPGVTTVNDRLTVAY
jgi:osmotically-inducible protein OsmY